MIEFSHFNPGDWPTLSILFKSDTVSHLGGTALAEALLANTVRAPSKISGREYLLRQHPERRLRIATESLRQVIDYTAFMCHPQCSIARDQAVAGSDIDCGLVVTQDPTDKDTELAFVDALREQGFSAYHASEVATISAWADRVEAEGPQALGLDDDAASELHFKARVIGYRQIAFATEAAMQSQAKQGPLDQNLAVYLAGYSI